ncbi:WD40 repeat domain-containing protein [Lewinella sp. 4G2]|uniref:WD40 repeat domain-containing protein n=1 Tax=Lewinella sp. 4G2 TaxID=1803372 RepID=UPI0007B4644D|nr:WD40 repeat domain-containing protein [Lewinella sp. 4G2]OAV46186.1 hypothetical protein A3850_018175 [Lewinella sp. 4G2]
MLYRLIPTFLLALSLAPAAAQDEQIYPADQPVVTNLWHRAADISPRLRAVEAGEFSPDGQYAVSGGKFGYEVIKWNVIDGTVAWRAAHESEVECVTFSPDGKRIASGGEDLTLRIWDAATGAALHVIRLKDAGLDGIAWSPDGRFIVGGDEAGNAIFFDATSYQEVRRINCGSTINSLDFTKDGLRLIVGGNIQTPDANGPGGKRYEGFARVIDVATGSVTLSIPRQSGSIKSVRWSPDEQLIATGGFDNKARLFSAATGALEKEFSNPLKIEAVAFTPDGQYLVTGGHAKAINFYRMSDRELALSLPSARVEYIDFSADGRTMLIASEDSGLLSCYLLQSDVQARGNYQQIADKQLNNQDLKHRP